MATRKSKPAAKAAANGDSVALAPKPALSAKTKAAPVTAAVPDSKVTPELAVSPDSIQSSASAAPSVLPSNRAEQAVEMDDRLVPIYANFARVMRSSDDLILDFGLNTQPFAEESVPIQVNRRLVFSLFTAKRLLAGLRTSVENYEAGFGPLETDVHRRVI
ncbi:MAG: hypothetical protein JWM11_4889 [Planctomycetaceae bacterium]|nr:hypothetical protein [Planctomycetaceae bacterium]